MNNAGVTLGVIGASRRSLTSGGCRSIPATSSGFPMNCADT